MILPDTADLRPVRLGLVLCVAALLLVIPIPASLFLLVFAVGWQKPEVAHVDPERL